MEKNKNKGCGKMFCCICGGEDQDYSAYCGKHGRSEHFKCGQIEDLKHSDSILLCEDCKLNNTKE